MRAGGGARHRLCEIKQVSDAGRALALWACGFAVGVRELAGAPVTDNMQLWAS
jgi:hypothetical protein